MFLKILAVLYTVRSLRIVVAELQNTVQINRPISDASDNVLLTYNLKNESKTVQNLINLTEENPGLNLTTNTSVQFSLHSSKTLKIARTPEINQKITDLAEILNHNLTSEEVVDKVLPRLGFKCPNSTEIEPCTCTTNNGNSLNCSEVNSFEEIKEILNTAYFPSTKYESFKYSPHTASADQEIMFNNTFGPLTFNEIYITRSGLKIIEQDAFNGSQDTLETVLLDSNGNFYSFPFDTFLADFKKIKTLNIIKSSLAEIPNLNSSTLEYLYLYDNIISYICYDTFKELPSLRVLDLSYNNIRNITPNGLYMTSVNFVVYLTYNKLQNISPFMNNQPSLFDESNNFLTTFSQEVYQPILNNNSYVDVSSNDIDCSELGWVEKEYQSYIFSDCDI